MKRLSIVLADDHTMMRAGIRALIMAEPDMHVVAEAANGAQALHLAREFHPDVLVMDILMPGSNGFEVMGRLKEACPEVRVLILTALGEAAYLRQMLAAGASGYLLKRAAAETLIEAIRAVAGGATYLDPAVASKVVSGFVGSDGPRGARAGNLSEREREVAVAVAQGFTNKEIAARLGISVKTAETHKANVMQKLELHSRAEIVRYALQQGWLEDA